MAVTGTSLLIFFLLLQVCDSVRFAVIFHMYVGGALVTF